MTVLGTSLNAKDIFDRLAGSVRPIVDFDTMGATLIDAGRDVEYLGRVTDRAESGPPPRVSADDYSFSRRQVRHDRVDPRRPAPASIASGPAIAGSSPTARGPP